MKRFIVYITALFVVTQFIKAEPLDSLILKGNLAYADGNYEQAIEHYQAVLNTGMVSYELYYNLGNAFYKQQQLAPAILNYERAILLHPDDEDVRYNLDLAKSLVVDKIEEIPEFFLTSWKKTVTRTFSSKTWAFMSIGAFIVMLVWLGIYFFTRQENIKRIAFWINLVMFILTIGFYSYSKQRKDLMLNHNTAIIFASSVTVKSSPDASGSNLFVLHEGTKVTVDDELGEWCEILIADGNKGWIKKENLEMI